MADRPIFSQSEQLILDEVRDLKKDTKEIVSNLNSMRICHLENKNDIKILNDKLDNHLKEHKRYSTPIINWILGGGLFAGIITILKYFGVFK